jgi:energy-coupling factor transporter transmembrane protein EcfT
MPRFLFAFAMEKESTSLLAKLHPTTMLIALGCMIVIVFSTLNLLALIALIGFLFLIVVLDRMPKQGTFTVLLVVLPPLIPGFRSGVAPFCRPEGLSAQGHSQP